MKRIGKLLFSIIYLCILMTEDEIARKPVRTIFVVAPLLTLVLTGIVLGFYELLLFATKQKSILGP